MRSQLQTGCCDFSRLVTNRASLNWIRRKVSRDTTTEICPTFVTNILSPNFRVRIRHLANVVDR